MKDNSAHVLQPKTDDRSSLSLSVWNKKSMVMASENLYLSREQASNLEYFSDSHKY
jgi:hypothetical protein